MRNASVCPKALGPNSLTTGGGTTHRGDAVNQDVAEHQPAVFKPQTRHKTRAIAGAWEVAAVEIVECLRLVGGDGDPFLGREP